MLKLIAIADKIENGTATRNIQKLYSELSSNPTAKTRKIYNSQGELLFTLSPTGSISINKIIFKKIDHNALEKKLSEIIAALS